MELASMKLDLLQKAKAQQSLQQLENSVQAGIELLNNIKSVISPAKEIKEVSRFLKLVENLKEKSRVQRAVVGVVGGTGAGKSSVINALLDEKSLVPTSGMRACTAVITEIAYNYSINPHELYRAEVQFISAEEWKHELGILLDELRTNPGTSGGNLYEGDVGIAYSKLQAVYPGITKEELLSGQVTPDSLINQAAVKTALGSRVKISVPTSDELSELLQKYIDSVDSMPNGENNALTMEYWPLVKVVKVFVRSPVLKAGLVLVDLPGVHDSNAARSAVAAKYVQECTGLWVIAPITRAVDDKSAQTLLGESFRRQLQIDGSYSAITFICSKTDDLSVEEILRAIPESEKAHETNKELRLLEPELVKLNAELAPMDESIKGLGIQIDGLQKEINALEEAIKNVSEGEISPTTVSFSPGKKRKQRAAAVESRKRTQLAVNSDYEDSDSEEDELVFSDCEAEEEIAMDDAVQKLGQMKQEQKLALDKKIELAKKARPVRKLRKELRVKMRDLTSLLENECLVFRNNFATPIIKRQFADGLKEIDQAMAGEDNPDTFDPDSETRDYQRAADQLPVFCVSSRSYQHKCGIVLQKSNSFPGFRNLEDTQIPQLKVHAGDIVRDMRIAGCRSFLGSLAQCLTSLMFQVVLADKPLKMADELKVQELQFLDKSLDKLREDLDKSIYSSFHSMCKLMRQKILDKFPSAVTSASEAAVQTVVSWAKSKNEGGLVFQTYRATCVRGGVFTGAKGPRNLNEELTAPLTNTVGRSWERVFSKSIPKRLDAMAEELASHLIKFQEGLEDRPQITQSLSYGLVKQQTLSFAETIKDTSRLKSGVDGVQREANRTFLPTVAKAMSRVYVKCGKEKGTGSLARMREYMRDHVERVRHQMFQEATEKVEDFLLDMIKDVQEAVDDRIQGFTKRIEDDYRSLIEGRNIFATFKNVREELRQVLLSADDRFECLPDIKDEDGGQPEAMDIDEIHTSSPVEPNIKLEPTT